MSRKYSSSPALNLKIADSPQRRLGHLALLLFYLLVSLSCLDSDYPLLALPVILCGLWSLPGLVRYRWAGVQLHWQRGCWSVFARGQHSAVSVLPGSRAFPGLIYLDLRMSTGGGQQHLWLFNDSADPQQLRRLRVRMRLEQAL